MHPRSGQHSQRGVALEGQHGSCPCGGRCDSDPRFQVFRVQWKGVDRMLVDLKHFNERAVPYGLRNALNSAAFEGRLLWQTEMKRTFVLRNQFTTRSVLVQKAQGTNVRTMHALLGSTAPYLATDEEGGRVKGKHGHKPIPGPVAAGQAAGSHRTRLVRAGRRLSAIKAAHGRPVGSRLQRNAIAISVARRANKKFALLERPNGGKGLFLLGGGKRKVKARLLWDLSRASVRIRPHPTLQRTLDALKPRLPALYEHAILDQLRRHRIAGYGGGGGSLGD